MTQIMFRYSLAIVATIMFVVVAYTALLNWIGPSTEYHRPKTPTSAQGADGRHYIYLGDEFYVFIDVVRHKLNGNCQFDITRYAEAVGPPLQGREPLPISYASLEFVGQNDLRTVRWPSPPDRYILGYAVDKNNVPIDGNTEDNEGNRIPPIPLLPDGVDEQEYKFYVKGRYYCNFLDYIFPRYIQGGERPNETVAVRLVLRRNKP